LRLLLSSSRQAELLDGGYDHFVGVAVRKQPLHQSCSIGVFFDATILKSVEFFPRLPIQVLAVNHKKAFSISGLSLSNVDALKEVRVCRFRWCPDIAIAGVLVDAFNNGFDSINLVRTHHQ